MARAFTSRSRRKTQWAGFGNAVGAVTLPVATTVAANTTVIISQALVVAGGTGLVDEEVTVTRMIGTIHASLGVDTAVTSSSLAIGCVIARNEAIAAGVASLPGPEGDPDAEWLYYGSVILRNPQNALRDGPASSMIMPFDVRGQRIIRAGSGIVWLASSRGQVMAAGVIGRALVKLT